MNINDWWGNYDDFAHVLWIFALIGSILFVIQTIYTFAFGGDEGTYGDADSYIDSDAGVEFQFFTLRNAIAFFTMFGWVGLAIYTENGSSLMASIGGMAAGALMVLFMAFLIKKINDLKEDGTMQVTQAIGKTATVYLTIPASRSGKGLIQLSVNGSVHELEAITDAAEPISSNSTVKVVEIIENQLLLVQKIA